MAYLHPPDPMKVRGVGGIGKCARFDILSASG